MIPVTLAAMYFVAVGVRQPEAWTVWSREVFGRTAGGGEAWHDFAGLPYLRKAPPMLGPSLVLVPIAAAYVWRSSHLPLRMLAFAVTAVLLVLGFSRRPHDYYALPALPLICVLLGAAAVDMHDRTRRPIVWIIVLRALACVAAATSLAVALFAAVGRPWAASLSQATAAWLLGALGIAAAGASWAEARQRARGAGWLVVAWSATLAAAGASNAVAERERFSKAEFAREIGYQIPPGVPLARLSGSLELVVHYADRLVDDVDARSLEIWIHENPGGLVLARRQDLADGALKGEVLLEETAPPGRDPMVLIEPFKL